jgi:hypothetical protein
VNFTIDLTGRGRLLEQRRELAIKTIAENSVLGFVLTNV